MLRHARLAAFLVMLVVACGGGCSGAAGGEEGPADALTEVEAEEEGGTAETGADRSQSDLEPDHASETIADALVDLASDTTASDQAYSDPRAEIPEDVPVVEHGPMPDFGLPFGCSTSEECQPGMICCDFMGSGMKMCLPESMCGGANCEVDGDCKDGQVCCKFGEMADKPMCMAEAMCPKECETGADCPPNQECCDLSTATEEQRVCIDKGQCPARCQHSTSECPLGQECCDAGDGLLVCVSASECPGSVSCKEGDICKNSKGEPNGFECCEVPGLGWRCVGSGGCGEWGGCSGHEDCPVGRECCDLDGNASCVPTGACPTQETLPPCGSHADCAHAGQECCIVPGMGTVCAPAAECPSQCLDDSDCTPPAKCCKPVDSPASCLPEAQCITGEPCSETAPCPDGQECCDMGGQSTCVPAGQCVIGGPCATDGDCKNGMKCCELFGQKLCMQQCFAM